MVRHYLQCQWRPVIPCANPVNCFMHCCVERFCQNAHTGFWNPDQMVVDIVHRVPCFPDLRNFNLSIFSKSEMLFAVYTCSILLQHTYNTPVCFCSCHFFSSSGFFCQRLAPPEESYLFFVDI